VFQTLGAWRRINRTLTEVLLLVCITWRTTSHSSNCQGLRIRSRSQCQDLATSLRKVCQDPKWDHSNRSQALRIRFRLNFRVLVIFHKVFQGLTWSCNNNFQGPGILSRSTFQGLASSPRRMFKVHTHKIFKVRRKIFKVRRKIFKVRRKIFKVRRKIFKVRRKIFKVRIWWDHRPREFHPRGEIKELPLSPKKSKSLQVSHKRSLTRTAAR